MKNEHLNTPPIQETAVAMASRLEGFAVNAVAINPEGENHMVNATPLLEARALSETPGEVNGALADSLKSQITRGEDPDKPDVIDRKVYLSTLMSAERDIALESYVKTTSKPSNIYDAARRTAMGIELGRVDHSPENINHDAMDDAREAVSVFEDPKLYDEIDQVLVLAELDEAKPLTPPGEAPNTKYLTREARQKYSTWRDQVRGELPGLSKLEIPEGIFEKAVLGYVEAAEAEADKLHEEGDTEGWKDIITTKVKGARAIKEALSVKNLIGENMMTAAKTARKEGKVPVDEITYEHSFAEMRYNAPSPTDEQLEKLDTELRQLGDIAMSKLVEVQFS